MGRVIRRALSHVAPEELLLVPVVILAILAILAQPTAITRLFETPFATPIPGDSPADLILGAERAPAPAPSPATMPRSDFRVIGGARELTPASSGVMQCPSGSTLRESPIRYPDGTLQTLSVCVAPDGSVLMYDRSGIRLQVIPVPGSISRP